MTREQIKLRGVGIVYLLGAGFLAFMGRMAAKGGIAWLAILEACCAVAIMTIGVLCVSGHWDEAEEGEDMEDEEKQEQEYTLTDGEHEYHCHGYALMAFVDDGVQVVLRDCSNMDIAAAIAADEHLYNSAQLAIVSKMGKELAEKKEK